MSNELPVKLTIDAASVANLKAELLRKQDESRAHNKTSTVISSDSYVLNKTASTWGKKKPVVVQQPQTSTISEVDGSDVEPTEDELFEKSRRMLEAKTKLYESATSGELAQDSEEEENSEETFLVDFQAKREMDKEVEQIGSGSLRLKTTLSESAYNEERRRQWAEASAINADKSSLHYQDIRFDEIRNMGVGNFQFSRNEQERAEQMVFFKTMQTQTRGSRVRNAIYTLKRTRALKERLSKVTRRKLLKEGFTDDEIKAMSRYESDINEITRKITELEELMASGAANMEEAEAIPLPQAPKRKVLNVREWDKDKKKLVNDKGNKLRRPMIPKNNPYSNSNVPYVYKS